MRTLICTIFTFLTLGLSAQTLTPRSYAIPYTQSAVVVDGEIYGAEWSAAPWTPDFVDIRGYDFDPAPKYATRAKMLYDDKNMYIAIEMVEPHIWATLTERDTTIYLDNDIELFIDPDGDSHNYMEFEFNAYGTEWDLQLTKPYSQGGTNINSWDLVGMKTAVKIYGTLNDPSDKDDKWVVEIALPLDGLQQMSRNKDKPLTEQSWLMNISRVEWLKYEIVDGRYRKLANAQGFGSEENWVWSPTGVVNMHLPELWGTVTFAK